MENREKIKYEYTYTYLKNKYKIEMLVSAIACISTIVTFKTNFIMYPISFIVFDIAFMLLNGVSNIILRFLYDRYSLEGKLTFIADQLSNLDNFYPSSNRMMDLKSDARYFLKSEKDFVEKIINEQKEEKIVEKEASLETSAYTTALKELKKRFTNIKTEENEIFLKDLGKKLSNIIKLVNQKPETSVFSSKLFDLYIPEIIALIDNIPSEADKKSSYMLKLDEVLKEVDNLADNTKNTISNFQEKSIDIAFEVLLRELKKDSEELND